MTLLQMTPLTTTMTTLFKMKWRLTSRLYSLP